MPLYVGGVECIHDICVMGVASGVAGELVNDSGHLGRVASLVATYRVYLS
jgi:hypothetical protein